MLGFGQRQRWRRRRNGLRRRIEHGGITSAALCKRAQPGLVVPLSALPFFGAVFAGAIVGFGPECSGDAGL